MATRTDARPSGSIEGLEAQLSVCAGHRDTGTWPPSPGLYVSPQNTPWERRGGSEFCLRVRVVEPVTRAPPRARDAEPPPSGRWAGPPPRATGSGQSTLRLEKARPPRSPHLPWPAKEPGGAWPVAVDRDLREWLALRRRPLPAAAGLCGPGESSFPPWGRTGRLQTQRGLSSCQGRSPSGQRGVLSVSVRR